MEGVVVGFAGGGTGFPRFSDSLISGSADSTGAAGTAAGSSTPGGGVVLTTGSAGGGDTGSTGSGVGWVSTAGAGAGVVAGAVVSTEGSAAVVGVGVSPDPHPTNKAAAAHETGKNLMRRKSTRLLFKSRLFR